MSDSLQPHGLQHARLPCPLPTPRVYSNSCPLSWWCHPAISSSLVPFSSCLQFFTASGSFPMSWFFTSGGQNIGVSASTSVLPINIQGWFPLGLTGWISWPSKGLLRVFSNTIVQKHQFFSAQLSLWSNSHIHMWLLEKTELWLDGLLLLMSLLFNMLSKLVIAFLPRSKCLLISWLQSPSAMILELKKIKSVIASIVSPFICHEVVGPDAMHDLSFLKVFVKHFLHLFNLYLHCSPHPKFWIIFSIIILNYFSGRLPVSISFSCFSWILSCSFIWNIILCLFILSNFLWLCFSFGRLQGCCSSCFCSLLLVHEAKRLVQAFWWEGLVVGETGLHSGD